MIDISKDRLRKLLQIKLSYNSLVDLQDADVYEIRIALNEVIKEIISEQCTNITNNKSSRTYIVSFELMVENLFEDYIEKLNLKTPLQKILQEKYEDIVNMDNDLHLGQSYIGRFSVDLFEKLSKQGKFCKVYSIFYKNSQFKQQIIDENQIETVYNNQKTSVVFKRSNEYDIELDNNKIKSQIYDIPYINWNTNFIRLFAPKANPNLNYENFIRGKIEEIYSEENKLASICQFVYTPQIDEFGKYIKFLQQKFLADSIVEDIFNDEIKFFKNPDNIEDHIQINIVETNVALLIIMFLQKLMDEGYDFEKALEKSNKIFEYFNINLHRESFELMDLSYLYQFDNIKNIIQLINENALKNGYPEIIKDNFLDCFNLIAFVTHSIIVGSEYQKKFLLKSEHVVIDKNIEDKIVIQTYGFNDDLFRNKIEYHDLYYSKLKYKKKLVDKYNLKNINDKSIFNMQLSDFHEGKRQILNVFYILYLYLKLKYNVNTIITPTTFFIGGMSSFDYLFCKKTISLCLGMSKVINSDKLIQEKIKLVFVENIMLDQVPDFAKACDVFNYIPYKNFDISNTYPYAFMNNGSIILTSDSSVYEKMSQLKDTGVFKFDEESFKNSESSCMDFILKKIELLENKKFIDEFYEIYNLILKYNDSFNVINSFDNFVEVNEKIQKWYLNENLWNDLMIKNIEISKKFGINYLKDV
ncbi:glycogen/starch/alpha-glucan phosphorylase [Finegoldia magna]|uniref:glycogen/starch/alpha-glucan phosphorylase n=1 Tax=Finegoldia magna TaxID=1260 RepID=UPI00290F46F1|nr:glycogen/starch/alpha-glucan phosphorylase [Finegoldia magna]MDU5200126.1 glycogen/starch/alpha-glucan phosphorylase [Finegoldia magna]MDU6775081.1 glycogen/starch/alpha-glucan phosphorylase [Finegoldia magna]